MSESHQAAAELTEELIGAVDRALNAGLDPQRIKAAVLVAGGYAHSGRLCHARAEDVIAAAAKVTSVSIAWIKSDDRNPDYVRVRHSAMYVLRQVPGWSFPRIGAVFGKRDHTTVVHAVKAVETRLQAGDERTISEVAAISALAADLADRRLVRTLTEPSRAHV